MQKRAKLLWLTQQNKPLDYAFVYFEHGYQNSALEEARYFCNSVAATPICIIRECLARGMRHPACLLVFEEGPRPAAIPSRMQGHPKGDCALELKHHRSCMGGPEAAIL